MNDGITVTRDELGEALQLQAAFPIGNELHFERCEDKEANEVLLIKIIQGMRILGTVND